MSAASATSEAVLLETLGAALVKVLGKRRGRAMLTAWTEGIATRAHFAMTVPLRDTLSGPARRDAALQAAEAYRVALPALIANLPQ